LVREAGFEPAT